MGFGRGRRPSGGALVAFCVALLTLSLGEFGGSAAPGQAAPEGLWVTLSGAWVRSSVALGDLTGDGVDDVVVGGSDGRIYAYSGTGAGLLWMYDTCADTGICASIESKPAIGDLDRDGHNEVVVGVGSTFTPQAPGGIWALRCNGSRMWYRLSGDFNGDSIPDGVHSSPALADVDLNDGGKLEVIYGGFDAHVRVLNHDGTVVWDLFTRDTIWSSPAIGDLDRDGKPEIVIGSDAHWEPAFGTVDGGKLYAFNGEDGTLVPGFFIQVDEVVWSAPALGDLNGDGWLEIVVGTGDCYEHVACASGGRTHPVTDAIYAYDRNGNPLPGWPVHLPEFTLASPALGDMDGDGDLEIVFNTGDGYVHVLHSDGREMAGWPRLVTTPAGPGQVVHFPTTASPVLADLTGDGRPEVILPSNWEIVVWDWTGLQLTRDRWPPLAWQWNLDTLYTVYGTPAVGDVDGDGYVELVAAGATQNGANGALYKWDRPGLREHLATAWAQFRFTYGNIGRYPVPPRVMGLPGLLLALHEYGDGNAEHATWYMVNRGDELVDWTVTDKPAGVTVTPSSGQLGWAGQVVDVAVSAAGFLTGTYDLGAIELSGAAGGQPVAGLPASIPVRLVVGDVRCTFLPLALRAAP